MGILKWSARIISLFSLLFGLPFYFGYGNPLPFVNPDYSLLDNIWLSAFPVIFAGLALGWKFEKLAGFLILITILAAAVIGFIFFKEGLPGPMFVPFIAGVLFLICGFRQKH